MVGARGQGQPAAPPWAPGTTYPAKGAAAGAGAEEAAEATGSPVLPTVTATAAATGQRAAGRRGGLLAREARLPQELRHVLSAAPRGLAGEEDQGQARPGSRSTTPQRVPRPPQA